MSNYRKDYYERHKDAIKEKVSKYYNEHKEEIAAKAKAKRDAEKLAGVIKVKKKYVYDKPLTPKQEAKKFIEPFKEKYKGFKFKYDGTVLSFEINLPFRIMVEEYGAKRCDDKEYARLQNILRRRLNEVDDSNKIVVLECGYIDAHITNMEKADEICEVCRDFVKEQLEIYGSYIKNGRKVGEHFE